jgi:hypothetical protein
LCAAVNNGSKPLLPLANPNGAPNP